MNMALLKEFFGWMTLINLLVFIIAVFASLLLRGIIQRIHGKMFGLTPEAINAFLYGYLGVYKIVFTVFVLIPWIALTIMS